MSNTKQKLEESLFETAANMPDPAERSAFLEGACRDDPALRARLELLLEGHFQGEGFLTESPKRQSAPPPPPPSEAPPTLSGRYQLLEKIGEGGFGEVWSAEQKEPVKRSVAVKILKPGMDTRQVVRRFEAERQTLALMDHPNIARVLDAGATDTGRPYFVMDLVRGVRITDYCDQHHLSTPERLALFIKVCEAIQHAHQKGIIHRDIKPSNILVTLHDGVPVPKVIDFGIAKATQSEFTDATLSTQFPQFLGTPTYVSPEQAERGGLDIDTRSDIYSLGVLLYELLTGKTPFDSKTLLAAGLDEMRRIIREQEPVRPSTRLTRKRLTARPAASGKSQIANRKSEIDRDLDWIVMKCLEKDRTRRYATANGLVRDLQRYLANEPVIARPPSTVYRLGKFVRRNKVLVGAASGVAAVLVLGIAVSAWEATVAARARTIAERQLYAARMNLAQREWEQNNAGRVRQLLDETAAYPERGFEWYYWQRQTHLELMTLRGHGGRMSSVAFSPDGQRIVTSKADRTATSRLDLRAKVWDAATGKGLLTLKGHRANIIAVAFSPDGQQIVTGSGDTTAKLWDALTGQELLTLTGHTAAVWSVAFSPDGQRIVTGSWDQTAKVWDAGSGRELLTLKGHRDRVFSVAFSPDGQRIVTGSWDQTAKVWDTASGTELRTLTGHTAAVWSAAFSPDGQRIVTGSHDRTAKVWEAATGRELLTLTGHESAVRPVAFSPDGQRIVTGSDDRTAKVWDASTGKELFTLKGHTGGIRSVTFSPDGQRIATGSEDETVRVWEAKDRFTLSGHRAVVMSVAFSPDGQRIVTGSHDRTAKVWEAASGKELLTLSGQRGGIRALAFSANGQRIITGSWDGTIRVREAASGKELLTLGAGYGGIRSLALSRDDQRIVAASWDQRVTVWNASTGKGLLSLKGHRGGVGAVAFSPDGRLIVTGGEDQTAKLWEATSGHELLTLKGHVGAISSVAFSPDGRRIVTGSVDQTAKVWETASGHEVLNLRGHVGAISSAAFSPDGQRIVTGSEDGTAKVWETTGGNEVLTLKGHSGAFAAIGAVAFSPDGQRIVTGSGDQTAKVWEAATAEQVAVRLREEEAANERLAVLEREEAAAAETDRALRAQDPGAIKQWLVLAPIPFEAPSGPVVLEQAQIPDEARIRPRAGERVKVGENELVWTEVQVADSLLDFRRLLGAPGRSSVAYAVCYLRAEARQTGLLLKVTGIDLVRMYLNGKEIYRLAAIRHRVQDPDVVAGVELNAGLNVVVFKVLVEIGWTWEGSAWFTAADGQPVPGLRVTLDPDAKP